MMFDLYPDILTVIPPRDATTDPSGDYDPAPAQETEYAICRAVRNGSGTRWSVCKEERSIVSAMCCTFRPGRLR